jgi:hypothetical protein
LEKGCAIVYSTSLAAYSTTRATLDVKWARIGLESMTAKWLVSSERTRWIDVKAVKTIQRDTCGQLCLERRDRTPKGWCLPSGENATE